MFVETFDVISLSDIKTQRDNEKTNSGFIRKIFVLYRISLEYKMRSFFIHFYWIEL